MTKTAKYISYLFHPVFMPLIGILIIFNSGIYSVDVPFAVKKYTYLISGLFSILFPLSVLPLFIYWKLIQNVELNKRKERIYPLVVTAISLIVLHIFMSRVIPIRVITSFTFSVAFTAIVLLFVNIFYKISMHLLGIGSICGLIVALSIVFEIQPFIWLALSITIAGIVASSRLFLNAHSLSEVTLGYTLGFLITGILMPMLIG